MPSVNSSAPSQSQEDAAEVKAALREAVEVETDVRRALVNTAANGDSATRAGRAESGSDQEPLTAAGDWHAAMEISSSSQTLSSASSSQPSGRRLLQVGLTAIRANLLPGLILQCFAVTLLVLYYASPAVAAAFGQVAAVKDRYGFLFSMLSTAIAGGVIPWLFIAARERSQQSSADQSLLSIQSVPA
jgi:hypothetical protein